MKNPRKSVTKTDLDTLPMRRLRRLYCFPKRVLISREGLKKKIKERRFMPYDDGEEYGSEVMGCDKVEKKSIDEMTWTELIKYSGLKPGPGVTKKIVMAQIRKNITDAKETDKDGCTNCTNDDNSCN